MAAHRPLGDILFRFAPIATPNTAKRLDQRIVWRWHFYAAILHSLCSLAFPLHHVQGFGWRLRYLYAMVPLHAGTETWLGSPSIRRRAESDAGVCDARGIPTRRSSSASSDMPLPTLRLAPVLQFLSPSFQGVRIAPSCD